MARAWDYRGPQDLRLIQALTTRLYSRTSFWHAGGIAWELQTGMRGESPPQVRLFGEPDRLSAWAFVEPPGRDLILSADVRESPPDFHLAAQVDPAAVGVADEVVGWFRALADGFGMTAVAPESDAHLLAAYREIGLVEDPSAPFALDMRRSLADLVEPALPPSYRLRSVTEEDLAARVAVHRAAWHPSRMSIDTYRATMSTWPYRPDLDVVVVAPSGEFAASCLIWLDPETGVGELEPVGTHPDHRGFGLGPAVCLGAMHRLRDAGGAEAVVHPRGDDHYPVPRKVYARAGFERVSRTRSYRDRGVA